MTESSVQIRSGRFSVRAAVDEPDQVRQMVIAEQAGDGVRTVGDTPRFVKAVGVGGNAVSVAKKSDIEGAAENAFIGAKPFEPFFGSDGERLIGDRTFG